MMAEVEIQLVEEVELVLRIDLPREAQVAIALILPVQGRPALVWRVIGLVRGQVVEGASNSGVAPQPLKGRVEPELVFLDRAAEPLRGVHDEVQRVRRG